MPTTCPTTCPTTLPRGCAHICAVRPAGRTLPAAGIYPRPGLPVVAALRERSEEGPTGPGRGSEHMSARLAERLVLPILVVIGAFVEFETIAKGSLILAGLIFLLNPYPLARVFAIALVRAPSPPRACSGPPPRHRTATLCERLSRERARRETGSRSRQRPAWDRPGPATLTQSARVTGCRHPDSPDCQEQVGSGSGCPGGGRGRLTAPRASGMVVVGPALTTALLYRRADDDLTPIGLKCATSPPPLHARFREHPV